MTWAFWVVQLINNPAMQKTPFWFQVRKTLCRRDRLPTPIFLGFPGVSDSKEYACNVRPGLSAWVGKIPWTEEPGRLQFMGSQTVLLIYIDVFIKILPLTVNNLKGKLKDTLLAYIFPPEVLYQTKIRRFSKIKDKLYLVSILKLHIRIPFVFLFTLIKILNLKVIIPRFI